MCMGFALMALQCIRRYQGASLVLQITSTLSLLLKFQKPKMPPDFYPMTAVMQNHPWLQSTGLFPHACEYILYLPINGLLTNAHISIEFLILTQWCDVLTK